MAGQIWTDKELVLLNEHYVSHGYIWVAAQLGRTNHSVKLKAQRVFKLKTGFRWTEEHTKFLVDNCKQLTQKQIAEELGITESRVMHRANRLGVIMGRRLVWTSEQDDYIRANANRLPKLEMAQHLGVDRSSLVDRASKLGITLTTVKPHDPWPPEAVEFLREHYHLISAEEIAEVLDKKAFTVIAKARREGLADPQGLTRPERQVQEILVSLGVPFTPQKSIRTPEKRVTYRADFALEGNYIIEVQGDYWHCNPTKYPNGPVTKEQRNCVVKDRKKRDFYSQNGYTVLEVWESDCSNTAHLTKLIQNFLLSRLSPVTG